MIVNDKVLQKLKEPVNEQQYCGTYIKLDRQAFRALRNVYNEANSAARKLLQTPDESELDELNENNINSWKRLSDQLCETFQKQTKDIELISWLMVSQLYLDDTLIGFKNTLDLLNTLLKEHFDELNPVIPEASIKAQDEAGKLRESLDFKMAAFSQMVGIGENDSILYAPMSQVRLLGNVSYFAYQSAEMKGECPKLREDLKKDVSANADKYKATIETLKQCKTLCNDIYVLLGSKCQPSGIQTPNFLFIINHLDRILKSVGFLTGFSIEDKKEQTVEEPVQDNNASSPAEPQTAAVQTIAVQTTGVVNNSQSFELLSKNSEVTREQVFEELANIAKYFRSTEPHSPVSYLIEKAIRWGHLSLPELLNELISDQADTKNRIFTIAGLQEGGTFNSDYLSSGGAQSGGSNNAPSQSTQQKNENSGPAINW
ncbi:MAG: type VI secretion system ImpA family N-terminal domain-containing protein [Succinivibrionaceae bacterium]|nr:type VI secretion system ImpA family N-terminal domain-containing protein [Succinivibrionaceae bacterium]